jgi:hypothetical protein
LAAVCATGGVDFFDRELPTLAIRFGESGQQRIAVDLADLDFTALGKGAWCKPREGQGK